MPLTATLEQIKAYQDKVEKDEITAHRLPPCPRCNVESDYFKIHAFRERGFLVIVEMIIQTVFCTLIRFRCPGCGKTVTNYPDFAIPYKRYTRQTVTGFAGAYVGTQNPTYQNTVISCGTIPGYANSDRTLAPSTVHRWVTGLSGLTRTLRTALSLLLQDIPASTLCRDLAQIVVPFGTYRSERRKSQLLRCRKLVTVAAFFQDAFNTSIFTKLATRCAFT